MQACCCFNSNVEHKELDGEEFTHDSPSVVNKDFELDANHCGYCVMLDE